MTPTLARLSLPGGKNLDLSRTSASAVLRSFHRRRRGGLPEPHPRRPSPEGAVPRPDLLCQAPSWLHLEPPSRESDQSSCRDAVASSRPHQPPSWPDVDHGPFVSTGTYPSACAESHHVFGEAELGVGAVTGPFGSHGAEAWASSGRHLSCRHAFKKSLQSKEVPENSDYQIERYGCRRVDSFTVRAINISLIVER